jgi:cytochrome c biogenesis protein CcmG/thiol:disulfide interchange protein DsbE
MSNDGRGGKPVGRLASDRSGRENVPTRSSRLGSWSAALPLIILALVVGLGGGTAIGWFIGQGSQEAAPTTTAAVTTTEGTGTTADAGAGFGVVTVSGDALPVYQSGSPDTAVGLTIPAIDGADFAGNAYTITANGNPKLILAVAHWCPYCQQALPVYSEWYASADRPADLEVFMLVVFTTPDRGNYPPGPWLVAEDWGGPVLADDAAGSMARALGIAAVPFSLLVSPDGTVASRTTGSLSAGQLDASVEYLASLSSTTTTP